MARLLGPDRNTRTAWKLVSGAFKTATGGTAVVYSDAQGSILASIAYYDPLNPTTPGGVISGSALAVDFKSEYPIFWFPDGIDTLYVSVDGGPLTEINAGFDARIDALQTQVAGIVGAGLVTSVATRTGAVVLSAADVSGVETPTGAQAKATAAQNAAIAASDPTGAATAAQTAAAADATGKANAAQTAATGAAAALAIVFGA